MKLLKILSLILIAIMIGSSSSKANDNIQVVTPDQFQNIISQSKDYLLDVRTPAEYAAGHIPGAHQANWEDPASFKKAVASLNKDQTIMVYCRSGRRSYAAAQYLTSLGYKVVDLDGGFMAWEAAREPIEKGVPSLESRQ